jgi:CheY-like chemotaxis protein
VDLPQPTRVLVVDDESTIRELLAEALGEAGFDVETASNGVQALKVMQHWIPEVIVLDLMMPRLDGSGFTELMRLNPRYARVPILLLTAAYGAEQAAVQMGARAWLTKPFELDHLVHEVAALAGGREPPRCVDVLRPHARDGTLSQPEM